MTQVSKNLPISPKQAVGCAGPLDALFDPVFFKALSDPTRVTLLGCLAKCGRACSVSEVAECCVVDFSVVSRHLALLERAGVVESSKEGRTVFYKVKYARLTERFRGLAEALSAYEACAPGDVNGGGCCGK